MKKAILAVLMVVMLGTPSMAEVETNSLTSIEGTLWERHQIGITSWAEGWGPRIITRYREIGFHQGTTYSCANWWGGGYACDSLPDQYFDLMGVSISYVMEYDDTDFRLGFAIMQPIGLGAYSYISLSMEPSSLPWWWDFGMGIMLKVDDNWAPPEEE